MRIFSNGIILAGCPNFLAQAWSPVLVLILIIVALTSAPELQADAGFDGKKTEKEGSRDRKALNTQNSELMGEKVLSVGLNTWVRRQSARDSVTQT